MKKKFIWQIFDQQKKTVSIFDRKTITKIHVSLMDCLVRNNNVQSSSSKNSTLEWRSIVLVLVYCYFYRI